MTPVTRLQRLGVEGDDLVLRGVVAIEEVTEEQPTGPEHREGDALVRIFVLRDLGAVVSEAADVTVI